MTGRKRFLIGGIGALTPILLTVLTLDIAILLSDKHALTQANIFWIALRNIVLFILGGLVSYLHEDEQKSFKLFEIGIAAQALLTSLVAVQAGKPVTAQPPAQPTQSFFVTSAYAAGPSLGDTTQHIVLAWSWREVLQGATGGIYKTPAKMSLN